MDGLSCPEPSRRSQMVTSAQDVYPTQRVLSNGAMEQRMIYSVRLVNDRESVRYGQIPC